MNCSKSYLAAFALSFAMCLSPAFAAPYSVKNLAKVYNGGNYLKAQEIAEKRILAEPTDFGARYYLANIYLRLNKTDQAIVQYRACANSGAPSSTALVKYSSKALESLLRQKEMMLMAASADKPSDKEINDFKKRLAKETQQEDQRIHKEWSQALLRLSQNYDNRAGYNRGYGSRYDYQRQAQERMQIDETYSRRLKELSEHEQVMLSHANCGTSRIRMAPGLSSSKVQNYINYGSDADAEYIPVDNPLTAQAKKLTDTSPVKAKHMATRTKKAPAGSKKSSDIATFSKKPASKF